MKHIKLSTGTEIHIIPDEYPENPREWDNYCTMICFHGRYSLGDKHNIDHRDYPGWDAMEKALNKEYKYLTPLYLYDHSGITISTKPFKGGHAAWDSGRVGFIGIKRDKEHTLREKKSRKIIDQEVETYDQYLTGDVWCYSIEDTEGEEFDRCSGFFGDDILTNGMLGNMDLTEKEKTELKTKL